MKDKIALEEHFAIDLTIEQSRIYARPGVWEKLRADLLDVEQQRLERMEESGTAFSILSLNAPGTQGIPDRQNSSPSRAELEVRIPAPAESPSLSRSCFRASRTPAFRAAVRGWLGDRVGRDAQGVSR